MFLQQSNNQLGVVCPGGQALRVQSVAPGGVFLECAPYVAKPVAPPQSGPISLIRYHPPSAQQPVANLAVACQSGKPAVVRVIPWSHRGSNVTYVSEVQCPNK